jgi:hypothetical protein
LIRKYILLDSNIDNFGFKSFNHILCVISTGGLYNLWRPDLLSIYWAYLIHDIPIKHILSKQLWVEAIDNVRAKGKIFFFHFLHLSTLIWFVSWLSDHHCTLLSLSCDDIHISLTYHLIMVYDDVFRLIYSFDWMNHSY